MDARSIIKMEYGSHSKNFMTPRVLEYGMIATHLAYELSTGEGLREMGQKAPQIWGVSVVEYDGIATRRRTDLSGCHRSLSAARANIALMGLNPPMLSREETK